jgi:enoyl-CoA hydratase/carnithine racemase
MELKATTYRLSDGIAWIGLSRPHRRNAWTGRMHAEYRWLCAEAERDQAVRVVVVHGDVAGKAFCVGADMAALVGHVERGGYDDGLPTDAATPGTNPNPALKADFAWQLALRIPIVVAINGACAGVALALAAFADMRFVAEDAVLTTAAPRLGLPAEYGLSWILPRVMHRQTAVDVLLSGRRFSGREAADAGFAVAANDPSAALAKAGDWARQLVAGASPFSVEMAKRQLGNDLVRHDLAASVTEATVLLNQAMSTDDYREGVAALTQRRDPSWVAKPS